MKKINDKRGIGLTAIILIIAILTIGGYSIYKVSHKESAEMNVDTEQAMKEADEQAKTVKADVAIRLADLKSTLESNLDLEAKLDTANSIINEIKNSLSNISVEVSGNVKTEISDLQAKVLDIQGKLDAGSVNIIDTIDNVINEIQDSITGDSGAMMEGDTTVEGNAMMIEGSTTTDGEMMVEEDSMSEGDEMTEEENSSMEMEADVNIEAELNL